MNSTEYRRAPVSFPKDPNLEALPALRLPDDLDRMTDLIFALVSEPGCVWLAFRHRGGGRPKTWREIPRDRGLIHGTLEALYARGCTHVVDGGYFRPLNPEEREKVEQAERTERAFLNAVLGREQEMRDI